MREYPRNVVLLDVLSEIHETTEREMPRGDFFACLRALWAVRNNYDALLILQPTQELILPLFVLKPFMRGEVIGDAFTSLYDTVIEDRALAGAMSLKAFYYAMLDRLLIAISDVLFFDTAEHEAYFRSKFVLGKRRTLVVPVAVDMAKMEHVTAKKLPHHHDGDFEVLFCGKFIPLQGIEHIIRAAALLRDEMHIHFTLLGNGQTYAAMQTLANDLLPLNLTWIERVPYDDLLAYTKGADLSLGIFGGSAKASRVISNKVVESLALGAPLVTLRNPPLTRLLKDGESVFFANPADPEDLAKTIRTAYNTKDLKAVGEAGKRVAARHMSEAHLKEILASL